MQRTNPSVGFFKGLVDFNFETFVTLKFVKVIYALLFVLICLAGLVMFVGMLTNGGFMALLAFVFVPLAMLLYIVLARVLMESVALFFRIGENTSLLARAAYPGGGESDSSGLGGPNWGDGPAAPGEVPGGPTLPYPSGGTGPSL